MGHILKGQSRHKTFTISNTAKFRVKFKLIRLSEGLKNRDGLSAFVYIPDSGIIEPNGTTIITVSFTPNRLSLNFY